MPILQRRGQHEQDKTVRVGGVDWTGDKTRQFSVVLNIFETEQLQIGNSVETRPKLSCLVANSVHTADTDKTRQDSYVLSVSAVWTRHNPLELAV